MRRSLRMDETHSLNPTTALTEALAALEAGRPEGAVRILSPLLALQEPTAPLCAVLGIALAKLGDLPAAVQTLERAHYLQPQQAWLLFNYGLALELAGRAGEARLRYQAAATLNPALAAATRRLTAAVPATVAEFIRPDGSPVGGGAGAPAPSSPSRDPQPGPAPAAMPARVAPSSLVSAPRSTTRPLAAFPAPPSPAPERAWDPEPLPGLGGLLRAGLELWLSRLLVWALLPLPACLAAAFLVPLSQEPGPAAVLPWLAAASVGAAPALTGLVSQWLQGDAFPHGKGRFVLRSLRALPAAVAYLFLSAGPLAVAASGRTSLEPLWTVLAALFAAAPLHALAAPGLLQALANPLRAPAAVRTAWQLAGARTWLHLACMVLLSGVGGGILLLLGWSYTAQVRWLGEVPTRLLNGAALSVGVSIWSALTATCGLDAHAAAEAEGEGEPIEEPHSGETDPVPVPAG